jgi:carbamoyltransferase
MNPSIKDGKDKLNRKVKHREWYRPFGASVLEDKALEYFSSGDSPYMLYVVDVLDKESFPAITHADGTCRPQTVSSTHEIYYELISEFEKLTGIPMLLNTSLNNGGKPICGSPNDALELLSRTEMDSLVIGNTIY